MNPAIHSATSGMRAAYKMLDASAHNTANVETRGYKKVKVQTVESAEGGVDVRHERDNGPGRLYSDKGGEMVESSNVDLAEEAVNQIKAKHMHSANAAVFGTDADMKGTLLDIIA